MTHLSRFFFSIDDDTFGIAAGRIPDNALFSSSALNQACGASQARLNKQPCKEKYGAWSPMYNDKNQYLDVDLGKLSLLLLDTLKALFRPPRKEGGLFSFEDSGLGLKGQRHIH